MKATSISLKLFLLLFNGLSTTTAENSTIKETVQQFNADYKFELNIFIKLPQSNEDLDEDDDWLREIATPKLVITDLNKNITALYKFTTGHCLTLVYVDLDNIPDLFIYMDKLLWKLHLSNIMIVWRKNLEEAPYIELFEKCWERGFINVVLWSQQQLFTYNPYPEVEIMRLPNLKSFSNKLHLNNFHYHGWRMPFLEYAPRCFSYIDRHGNLIRSGTYFKIIELFTRHHNGTMILYDLDMWSQQLTQALVNELVWKYKYDFITNSMFVDDFYASSDTLWISSSNLIVPTSNEIVRSSYLYKPFPGMIWLLIFLIFMLVFGLIFVIHKRKHHRYDKESTLLKALAIVNFLPYGESHGDLLLNFVTCSMTILAGLLLTNFYSCNLSSLFTTKLYDAELRTLEDIAKTPLYIYEYTLDVNYYKSIDLPAIVYKRLTSGNNTYMKLNRQLLNVDRHIFCAFDDVSHYLMLQQKFLKKPKAKLLDEASYTRSYFVAMAQRSPILHHFNRYLLYIKESGIVHKLIGDSEWDGIRSGNIHYFKDPDPFSSLTLEHFLYGFLLWLIGLGVSLVCLLLEIYFYKKQLNNI